MRALTRIRTLAAMCALLSFLTASVLAGVPGRPIDRPEGPPDPSTEVGDPEPGHNGMPAYFRDIIIAAHIWNPTLRRLGQLLLRARLSSARSNVRILRTK